MVSALSIAAVNKKSAIVSIIFFMLLNYNFKMVPVKGYLLSR